MDPKFFETLHKVRNTYHMMEVFYNVNHFLDKHDESKCVSCRHECHHLIHLFYITLFYLKQEYYYGWKKDNFFIIPENTNCCLCNEKIIISEENCILLKECNHLFHEFCLLHHLIIKKTDICPINGCNTIILN